MGALSKYFSMLPWIVLSFELCTLGFLYFSLGFRKIFNVSFFIFGLSTYPDRRRIIKPACLSNGNCLKPIFFANFSASSTWMFIVFKNNKIPTCYATEKYMLQHFPLSFQNLFYVYTSGLYRQAVNTKNSKIIFSIVPMIDFDGAALQNFPPILRSHTSVE